MDLNKSNYKISVIGLGYVGLPLAHAFAKNGYEVLGFDINDYPATAELFDRLLLLPMNHLMSEGDANYVAESIISYYKN